MLSAVYFVLGFVLDVTATHGNVRESYSVNC
jgi:hypothetical protein